MRSTRTLIVLTVVVGAFSMIFAGIASANSSHLQRSSASTAGPLHPFGPGLDPVNYNRAFQQLMTYASVNPGLGHQVASRTGASTFNPANYRVVGWGKATGTNTGQTGSGSTVAARDTKRCHKDGKVLLFINIMTQKQGEVCPLCINPRLRAIINNLPKRPWSRESVLPFQRFVSKTFARTCPSGQKVTVPIHAWVKGVVSFHAWGELQGKFTYTFNQHLKAVVGVSAKIVCGKAPKPKAKVVTKVVTKTAPSKPAPVPAQQQQQQGAGGQQQQQQGAGGQQQQQQQACIGANACSTTPTTTTTTVTTPAAASVSCVKLTVNPDLNVNLRVNAHVDYTANNAALAKVVFSWGDGSSTDNGANVDASHTYSAGGSRTVGATLTFNNVSGGQSQASCSAVTVTPKDGTQGAGSTTSGSTGGTGAGGTAGSTTTGSVCRDPATGNIRSGMADQFGYCV